ncbi:MAG: hypothetical protein LBF08_04015 [Dysgonamonadaceae bacterium]|jgi:hypothetical protein|nr:hypothetical protein [Dysgonamonadaceae bacterium]
MKTIRNFTLITFSITLINACGESENGMFDGIAATGKGGSTARFTVVGDYLYAVDNSTLRIIDLSNPAEPEHLKRKDQSLGFGIETVFNKDTLLFIGSQDGVYIYSVARPDFPERLSFTSHLRNCDPVVAAGNYAYVTLNSENAWCGGWENALNIYDISDLKNPKLKFKETLNYPKGLGIDGNKLFVCDAKLGIKVYDVTDPVKPVWIDDLANIREVDGVTPHDVIPVDGLLLAVTDKGLYQFDYTGEKLKYVSKITIKE